MLDVNYDLVNYRGPIILTIIVFSLSKHIKYSDLKLAVLQLGQSKR